MDKEKAYNYTIERINSIRQQSFETESERKIAKETLEYLEYVKNMFTTTIDIKDLNESFKLPGTDDLINEQIKMNGVVNNVL